MPRQEQDKFMMRFPPGWKMALKIAAARNDRSMNAEIVHRLKPTVEDDMAKEAIAQK